MVSFNLKNRRVGNSRNSFKKYPIKNMYKKSNTALNVPSGINGSEYCQNPQTKLNCSDEEIVYYCNGKVFRRPIPGYRKVSIYPNAAGDKRCDIKMQEIYKDSVNPDLKTLWLVLETRVKSQHQSVMQIYKV